MSWKMDFTVHGWTSTFHKYYWKTCYKAIIIWQRTRTSVDHIFCPSVPEKDADVQNWSKIGRGRPWPRSWTFALIYGNIDACLVVWVRFSFKSSDFLTYIFGTQNSHTEKCLSNFFYRTQRLHVRIVGGSERQLFRLCCRKFAKLVSIT